MRRSTSLGPGAMPVTQGCSGSPVGTGARPLLAFGSGDGALMLGGVPLYRSLPALPTMPAWGEARRGPQRARRSPAGEPRSRGRLRSLLTGRQLGREVRLDQLQQDLGSGLVVVDPLPFGIRQVERAHQRVVDLPLDAHG